MELRMYRIPTYRADSVLPKPPNPRPETTLCSTRQFAFFWLPGRPPSNLNKTTSPDKASDEMLRWLVAVS
jgi:hypothetical protein